MKPPFFKDLVCVVCGRATGAPLDGTCPECGVEGILDVRYDMDAVRASLEAEPLSTRDRDIWRYRELLPLSAFGQKPPQPVGWTPIIGAPRLANDLGIKSLLIKDDGRNPTASFKDRASAVGVARALERGAETIACASTGNAASSLAGMAAGVGLKAVIFVPERAPEAKIAQLRIFGARVFRVEGPYEAAYDLCQAACGRYGWYNRNCAVNPCLVEGKKTAGLEIAEQLEGRACDWVVVSVGDGCTIAGVWKGLVEMKALGLLDRLPRLLGVQARGARPVMDVFENGGVLEPTSADTLADSIAVGHPRNWRKAVNAVRDSKGAFVAVEDSGILDSMRKLARLAGVFGEPAGVAGVAGLKVARRQGLIAVSDTALLLVTGNGLKDVKSALQAAGPPVDIPADLAAVEASLS